MSKNELAQQREATDEDLVSLAPDHDLQLQRDRAVYDELLTLLVQQTGTRKSGWSDHVHHDTMFGVVICVRRVCEINDPPLTYDLVADDEGLDLGAARNSEADWIHGNRFL